MQPAATVEHREEERAHIGSRRNRGPRRPTGHPPRRTEQPGKAEAATRRPGQLGLGWRAELRGARGHRSLVEAGTRGHAQRGVFPSTELSRVLRKGPCHAGPRGRGQRAQHCS
eukprot:11229049-Alexandrium_andersonii.AAC.1